MKVSLYNSLSHSLEEFTPQKPPLVTFYSCGPTVYNFAHIGNMRAYIFADTVKRTLLYAGYDVQHVMNYTDVEDKIIRDALAKGVSLPELTEPYIEAFMEDIASVNILPATTYTKATAYIDQMVTLIEKLIERGFAYKTDDGSVYFDLSKDVAYGKLVTLNKDNLMQNAKGRMKSDEYDKDNVQDFALWKAWDENDGTIFWETSLGKGRPGWHIECSAMAIATLGETIDIHTGGVDNKFPHHENEIAQSECATGKPFARYFMHNEWILVEGKKMAKSAGNFFTLRDLITKGYSPLAFRYWLLTSHYRTQVNFSLEALEAAQTAYKRLQVIVSELSVDKVGTVIRSEQEKFEAALGNDLGTPECISIIWDMVKNQSYAKEDIYATLLDFDKALGLGLGAVLKESLSEEVLALIQSRDTARSEKDWATSDALRAKLENMSYEVKDTSEGTKVRKV